MNRIENIKAESPLVILVKQFKNPLVYVLLASTALAVSIGKITDSIIVFSVVVLNILIGFVQELRANRAIEALSNFAPEQVKVIRDGQQKLIRSLELVPGDIVTLEAGDKVPADLRLIKVKGLKCEEAALTGESVPTEKSEAAVPSEAALGDRKSMAYSGTLVSSGTGAGLVVATGVNTEFGRISELLEQTETLQTPLTKELARIANWITWSVITVTVLLFGVGLLRGEHILDAAFSAMTLAVATIPEGLPAVITIASAIGVRRMAQRRALIRNLPAVETLGSTTIICTDKTGTLTKNEMTVTCLWTPKGVVDLTIEKEILGNVEVEGLLRAGLLCNDAVLKDRESDHVGDPTEIALVKSANCANLDATEERLKWPRLDSVPFESETKYMATLHESPSGARFLFLKGAPEVIFSKCHRLVGGEALNLNALHKQVEDFAKDGLRVIAFALKVLETATSLIPQAELKGGFELLGLQGMIDPPREEAKRAIQSCQSAGIVVKMITGDHPETAKAIGSQLGLIKDPDQATTGLMLEKIKDQDEFSSVALKNNVFARVSPEHKLRLVEALQSEGEIVAMTGDGVNDSPALKRANIGIAMGRTGTAVAREAADMVLADDNFASIEAAVEEGRRVYDNLVKSLVFLLPTSIAQGLIVLAAVLFFPIINGELLRPVLPVQVLWINLITAVALALPLAFEVPEPDIMKRSPRSPEEPILNQFVIFRTFFVALVMALGTIGLFLWEYNTEVGTGISSLDALSEAQTMAVTAMVLFQVFYIFNCRSLKHSMFRIGPFSNRYVYFGAILVSIAQVGFVHLSTMNEWFSSSPLNLDAWIISIAVAVLVSPLIALEKRLRRNHPREDRPKRQTKANRQRAPGMNNLSSERG